MSGVFTKNRRENKRKTAVAIISRVGLHKNSAERGFIFQ